MGVFAGATGETYRYAVVGHGSGRAPARPEQQNVNFYEQVNELHKRAHLLWGGYSAHLGEYENWQIEYLEAMDTARRLLKRCVPSLRCRLLVTGEELSEEVGDELRVSSRPPKR
ncbi:hypothetical protein [Streptomyces sp. NPDC006971]|uniref:hypothetical protein n=1 Tax=Streptomyces sp. NPDC006971 TaxID=3154784 RepID=UPI0033EEF38A